MRHRPEIDGLRALAVIPVVLFHAGLPGFSGGFIGVDVFFVISGYLITLILVTDLARNRLSLRHFYRRRARRILPALCAMMLVTLPFAWGWMSPDALARHAADVVSVLSFSTNFLYLIRDGSYFAPDAELQPLLHTWSLAVEEQFYLLYPVALLLVWRAKPRLLLPALALCAVTSFVAADWAAANHPRAAFYLLASRAWELLFGAIVALLPPPRRNPWLGLAGIAMIIASVPLFDANTPFPGRHALLPVLGTALALRYASIGTPAARLLSLRPLTFIGLISYSTYLWHQPLLAFARLRSLHDPDRHILFFAVVLSFVLGWASWRLIEQPFRKSNAFRLAWFGPAVAILAIFATFGLATQGASFRFPPQVREQLTSAGWSSDCLFQKTDGPVSFPVPDCTFGSGPHRVALLGDSVAASFAPALVQHFKPRGVVLSQMTHGLCYPARHSVWNGALADPCPGFIARAIDHINATGYDLVIVMASWPSFNQDVRIDGRVAPPLDDETAETLAADISDTIASIGAPVLLLMPQPQAPVSVRDYAARYYISQGRPLVTYSQSLTDFMYQQGGKFSVLERVTGPNLQRLYPHETLCDATACPFVENRALLLSDTMHLTETGSTKLIDWPQLRAMLP